MLTDNALVYTTRFAGGRGGRNPLETTLADLGITQKHSRPNHPTTCGKVERFQQTLKRWLVKQPPPQTLTELQAHLDAFVDEYNHRRPHSSLADAPPPSSTPCSPRPAPPAPATGAHHRVRHDRIDKTGAISLRRAGRLHHIGIGRAHAGTHRPRCSSTTSTSASSTPPPANSSATSPSTPPAATNPAPKRNKPEPPGGSGLADVSRHHTGRGGGI